MTGTYKCVICGAMVEYPDLDQHLRDLHAGPHKFYFDGREYATDKPSMLVRDVIAMVGADPIYQFYEDRGGMDWIALDHGNAVDLTRAPRFLAIPQATMSPVSY